ncbi:unnamed protein product [Cochlearia groenlandica]
MTDPEKLTALKKAYADTILNTAKEAAARVMISEKKARGYQLELVSVRDEALRTCLRLKHMYDLKVKEAEMISFQKQQKIEELEAQLGEAEDIVGELRTELQESRCLIEKLANGHRMNLSNEANKVISVAREEDSSKHERPILANGIKAHVIERDFSINRCSYKENQDPCHHTLPSILSRRIEANALGTSIANGDCCPNVESLTLSKPEVRKEEEKEDKDSKLSPTSVSPCEKQCIKFTFKRKRKKGASSNSSPEGGSSSSSQDDDDSRRSRRQKTGEKDMDSFNNEPSRDSRRVAQVARQVSKTSTSKHLLREFFDLMVTIHVSYHSRRRKCRQKQNQCSDVP